MAPFERDQVPLRQTKSNSQLCTDTPWCRVSSIRSLLQFSLPAHVSTFLNHIQGPSVVFTYPHSSGSTEFCLQAALILLRHAESIGVDQAHRSTHAKKSHHEGAKQHASPAGREVVIVMEGNRTQDIVILVYGLAVVAAVLLVPPVAVGVTLAAKLARGVDVATVLPLSVSNPSIPMDI